MDEGAEVGARTPEQIDELMLAAYESRDAEAVADLYEDDAIFSNPPDGWTVVGRAAIIEKLNEMFSMTSSISWVDSPMKSVVVGDYAAPHLPLGRVLDRALFVRAAPEPICSTILHAPICGRRRSGWSDMRFGRGSESCSRCGIEALYVCHENAQGSGNRECEGVAHRNGRRHQEVSRA
jgi:hypothetical protein